MKTSTMKVKNLKQSEDILEIRPVNSFFVSRYRQAMRNGDEFPPILIDKKSKTIVSGNHRYQAYVDEFGEDYDIEVIEKTYKAPSDIIEDSVRENTKHGNPLDGISRRRAALKLMNLGKDVKEIAQLLSVSVKRIEDWGGMTVLVLGGNKNKPTPKPHKRGADLTGKTISEEKYQEHIKKDRGVSIETQARQIIRFIRNDWIDMTDPENRISLKELQDELNQMHLDKEVDAA